MRANSILLDVTSRGLRAPPRSSPEEHESEKVLIRRNLLRALDVASVTGNNDILKVSVQSSHYPLFLRSEYLFNTSVKHDRISECAHQLLSSVFSAPQAAISPELGFQSKFHLLSAPTTHYHSPREPALSTRTTPEDTTPAPPTQQTPIYDH